MEDIHLCIYTWFTCCIDVNLTSSIFSLSSYPFRVCLLVNYREIRGDFQWLWKNIIILYYTPTQPQSSISHASNTQVRQLYYFYLNTLTPDGNFITSNIIIWHDNNNFYIIYNSDKIETWRKKLTVCYRNIIKSKGCDAFNGFDSYDQYNDRI